MDPKDTRRRPGRDVARSLPEPCTPLAPTPAPHPCILPSRPAAPPPRHRIARRRSRRVPLIASRRRGSPFWRRRNC